MIEIDNVAWILLAVAVASAFTSLWARFLPMWLAAKAVKRIPDNPRHKPGVKASVIVYGITGERELLEFLDMAMHQDYPDYEVILVNEGGAETSRKLAEQLAELYPERLYVTFIPPQAHNLSRRKLAQTIGIKAATGDVVVTTQSNCRIPSARWLSTIMQPFANPGVAVSLGYSHVDFSELKGLSKWYRGMDATLIATNWIGAAAEGRPYRGDGSNLAFRRSLFFDAKGYSHTIHLMDGDDDIFLHQIMTGYNTRLAISPDAILTSEWEMSADRVLADLKERYLFTQRYLPPGPFLRSGLGSVMQWVMTVAAVAAALVEAPDLLPMILALSLLLVTWVVQAVIYRKAARRLESVSLWIVLPLFLLWEPIGNALFKYKLLRHKYSHYTFTR